MLCVVNASGSVQLGSVWWFFKDSWTCSARILDKDPGAGGQGILLEEAGKGGIRCPECGSRRHGKWGGKNAGKGRQQRYMCECGGTFTFNPGFLGRRYPNGFITKAVRIFMREFTAREAAEELASDGRKPHYTTVCRWVRDFTCLVAGYVRKIGAQAGYVWSTDEIVRDMLGMKGACISTVMDRGTRFCLSILVSPTKDGQNSAELFESARQMAGHAPLVTISDALDAIQSGHREAFGREECSIHVRETHIRNQRANNNGHERFNLTLSDMLPWRKTRMTGPVLQAGWLYYNFLCPHMSLGGCTHAEKAGIRIEHKDKLLVLIQNAAMSGMPCP